MLGGNLPAAAGLDVGSRLGTLVGGVVGKDTGVGSADDNSAESQHAKNAPLSAGQQFPASSWQPTCAWQLVEVMGAGLVVGGTVSNGTVQSISSNEYIMESFSLGQENEKPEK